VDVYARAGNLEEVESLLAEMDLDAVKYGILVRAYAKRDKADQATAILHQILNDPVNLASFDQQLFTAVIDAWSASSQRDAFEQSEAIFRLADTEKCRKLGVVQCNASYGAMLKCIVKLRKKEDAGERAEALLNEMEQRGLRPNQICYTLALRACYNAGDMERAEALMTRLENSDTPPNARTFTEILMHFADQSTKEAAERCESILAHMKAISRKRPLLKPDQISYNCAMSAWRKADLPESAERMSKIFERMLNEGIEPDLVSFNQLMSMLSKSNRRKDVLRADDVLMTLEKTSNNPETPNSLHYVEVMVSLMMMHPWEHYDSSPTLLLR